MTLKVISQGHSLFAGLFKCNPSHIYAAFYQISNDSVTWPTVPKMGVVKVTWLLNFGQISVISRKWYKIETYFRWKTNRKSYVSYWMAPTLLTLKVIHQLQAFSSAILKHLCSILSDFNWQHARAVPQQQLGFLFFYPQCISTAAHQAPQCIFLLLLLVLGEYQFFCIVVDAPWLLTVLNCCLKKKYAIMVSFFVNAYCLVFWCACPVKTVIGNDKMKDMGMFYEI